MTRTVALCVAVLLLLLCFMSLHSVEAFAPHTALTITTASTYSREIDRLIALLANRVKHLMPSKAESKKMQNRKKKAKEVAQMAGTPPKRTLPKHPPTEHFQNTSDSKKAFNNINHLAQTPTQLKLKRNNTATASTANTAFNQQLSPAMQAYVNATRKWYTFYNQTLTVAVNSMVHKHNNIVDTKQRHRKLQQDTHKKNMEHANNLKDMHHHTLKRYGIHNDPNPAPPTSGNTPSTLQ